MSHAIFLIGGSRFYVVSHASNLGFLLHEMFDILANELIL